MFRYKWQAIKKGPKPLFKLPPLKLGGDAGKSKQLVDRPGENSVNVLMQAASHQAHCHQDSCSFFSAAAFASAGFSAA